MQVANESHGRQEDESHFHVLIVDEAFDGVKLIQRHRLVSHPIFDYRRSHWQVGAVCLP